MRVRTLFVVKELPFPMQGGNDLRVWQNVRAACAAGPVGVFALTRQPPSAPPHSMIERWVTSQDADLFPATRGPEALAWLRDPHASPADSYFSDRTAGELGRLVDEFCPDVAVVEDVYLHRYIPLLADYPVVVDAFNVEADVNEELARVSEGAHKFIRRRFTERVARLERETVEAATRVWVCSARDRAMMLDRYPSSAPITVIPNGVDVDSYPAAAGDPLDLVYPAGFAWLPNERAALMLVDEVMPKLPSRARLTLCGNRVPPSLQDIEDPRVEVTGWVSDIRPYLARAGCLPMTLREGGGTRLKAAEAFAARLPVVSTAKGIQGMGVEPGRHYLPAETAAEFADAIHELGRDPDLGNRLADAAEEFVRDGYSWAAAERIIRADLESVTDAPAVEAD